MRTLLLVGCVLALGACKKKVEVSQEAPAPAPAAAPDASDPKTVPISNDPRNGAAMISAAQRAAALAGQDNARRDDGAHKALGGE